jgi:hypothetical protein
MGPGPTGWGLGVGLTIPSRKNLPVRKSEMWSRTSESGEDPLWSRRPTSTLGCSVNEEEENTFSKT